jgi:hypothetical protein
MFKGKKKASEGPGDWTTEDVVGWLDTEGFGPDVYERFKGMSSRSFPNMIQAR